MIKTLIAINCDISESEKLEKYKVDRDYVDAIKIAGGIPIIIPPFDNKRKIRAILNSVDGVLLTGGKDLNPKRYGEKIKPDANVDLISPEKEYADILLCEEILKRDIPTLAICLGMQVLNVVGGGSLYQDIDLQCNSKIKVKHRDEKESYVLHKIKTRRKSMLYQILQRGEISVPSSHHQAVKSLGEDFIESAYSADGITEAFESKRHSFLIGIQWHPEKMIAYQEHRKIFEAFVNFINTGKIG